MALKSIAGWLDNGAVPAQGDPRGIDWLRVAPYVALHAGCLGVLWVGVSTTAVTVAIALYALRMFAITGFYHRYFSHRAFRTSRALQFVFALLARHGGAARAAVVERAPPPPPRARDAPEDAHSARRHGFLWSHLGWFLARENFATRRALVRDLARYPELRFLDRYDALAPLALGAAALRGRRHAAPGVGAVRVDRGAAPRHLHASTRVAHRFGTRRYATRDDSRNNGWLALLTFGEGWHNNHHHFPGSARQGLYWWEVDLTYYGLRLLAALGLIWDLKEVPRMRDRDRRSGIAGNVVARRAARQPRHHGVRGGATTSAATRHTHTIELGGERHAIDTGFIVFNDRTYPNFVALLEELRRAIAADRRMSFSVRSEASGLEYNGTSLERPVRAAPQPAAAFVPAHARATSLRFNREAPALLEGSAEPRSATYLAARALLGARSSTTTWCPWARRSGPPTRRACWRSRRASSCASSTTTAC